MWGDAVKSKAWDSLKARSGFCVYGWQLGYNTDLQSYEDMVVMTWTDDGS